MPPKGTQRDPEDTNMKVLDFSGVKPFEPLDESKKYLCTVTNITPGQGPSGAAKEAVELTVMEPVEFAKRKLFREYSMAPQALPFFHEFLTACGEKVSDTFKYNRSKYIGVSVMVKVKNEEFDEQTRSRVQRVYPASKYSA